MTGTENSCAIQNIAPIEGDHASFFSMQQDIIAGVYADHLQVWKAGKRVAHSRISKAIPGYPQIVGRQILWGNGVFDFETGEYKTMFEIYPAMIAGSGVSADPAPGAFYRPTFSAWSEDGLQCIITAAWTGPSGPPPVRAVLTDKNGTVTKLLWEGADLPILAATFSKNFIAIATRNLRIFNRQGALLHELPTATPAIRINFSANEKKLMELAPQEIRVWNFADRQSELQLGGMWNDSSISASGQYILATGSKGELFCLSESKEAYELEEIPLTDPVDSITVGDNNFVASFRERPFIRTGKLNFQRNEE
ncbi:MAG: hypothetical protein H7Y27_11510 [Gemmatimonadaceae bacterium]|nr:hypothetical protein [Chitinophagaceae bacterium]